jgi:hypothetical protein
MTTTPQDRSDGTGLDKRREAVTSEGKVLFGEAKNAKEAG